MASNLKVWSLFDGSGYAALPWALKGIPVICFNFDGADHGSYDALGCRIAHPLIEYVNVWIDQRFYRRAVAGVYGQPGFIMAFPPCTDLAVSGAPAFARKALANPAFQDEAAATCRIAARISRSLGGVPYMIENPVSVLATLWRKPDYIFNPFEYGGYLPVDDVHPSFPQIINARDSYPKKTCLWTGRGFVMPEKKPVYVEPGYSKQHTKVGGKSTRIKVIRSLTPRGLAIAVCESNEHHMREDHQ